MRMTAMTLMVMMTMVMIMMKRTMMKVVRMRKMMMMTMMCYRYPFSLKFHQFDVQRSAWGFLVTLRWRACTTRKRLKLTPRG